MKKMKWPSVIRVLLTLALIYGAYTESGIWTALCLFFIFLNNELVALATSRGWL